MNIFFRSILFSCTIAALLFTAVPHAKAQQSDDEEVKELMNGEDPVDHFNRRLQEVVAALQERVNTRAQSFNNTIGNFYTVNILAPDNLDSANLPVGEQRVRDFLLFLSDYRTESDQLLSGLQDSISMLKELLPEDYRDSIFKDLFTTHIADEERFGKYTQALSSVYIKVLDLLNFLKTAQYRVRDHQLQFTVESDFKKYTALNEPILEANRNLEYWVGELKKAAGDVDTTTKNEGRASSSRRSKSSKK